jgi:hypothetical protein
MVEEEHDNSNSSSSSVDFVGQSSMSKVPSLTMSKKKVVSKTNFSSSSIDMLRKSIIQKLKL